MSERAWPIRLAVAFLLAVAVAAFGAACATKGYVRQETQKTADTLSARIDSNDKSIQQHSEQIRTNSNQIVELVSLNKQNTQELTKLNAELQKTDGKAVQARSTADQAQQVATRANEQIASLDSRFANRHQYSVVAEKVVYFKFNSSELEKSFQQDLVEVARIAKSNPDAIVAVEGRADNTGDADYNIRLGERRMESVVRFLVVEQGIPIQKVYSMSYGAANPIGDNQARDGRAKNRCAVVKVLAPPGGKG